MVVFSFPSFFVVENMRHSIGDQEFHLVVNDFQI